MADTSRSQLRKLKEEYARNPGSRVFVHLAEAHRKAGELKQAQQVLTDGLRRHGDYPSGLVVLARVLADQGEDERAAAVWRDVVRLDPENVVALRALGDIAEAAGHRAEAMQLYRRVLRLENGEPDAGEGEVIAADFDGEDAEPVSAAPAVEPAPDPVPIWRMPRPDPPAARTPEPEPEPVPAWRMSRPEPAAPAPEPVPEPEPEPAPAPASAKSRFSWLVRTVTGGRVEEPQPAAVRNEAPAREDTVFEPAAAAEPVPAETAYVPPVEDLPEPAAEAAPAPAEPVQVADPAELETDPAPLAAEPFEGVLDGVEAAELAPSPYVAGRWAESADNPEMDDRPSAEDEPIAYHPAPAPYVPDVEEEDEGTPGGVVVTEADEETGYAEPVPSIFEGADEDITRFVEAQARDQTVVAEAEPEEEASEDEHGHEPIRFEELAQLAYEGAATPADPLAQMRAELYAPEDAGEDDTAGGAAALAEVLVRLLERQGRVMHAESSLRRLLALALARELNLPPAQQDALGLAALLGALGELRDGGAADAGRQLAVTLQLLSGVALPETAREALAHQCERWDGGGLPAGLREEQIPFPARILAVARGAAALLAERRPGAGSVVDDLQRQAGTAFDPLVVSVLRRVFAQRERHGIGYGWGGRVAVAHPHELRALDLCTRLHGEGYAAETSGSAAAVRELLQTGSPQALVLGADLPDADTAALVREVRSAGHSLPVLVIDAPDARRRVELLGAGADVCFPPDAEFPEVRATLDALLRRGETTG
jgi:CheY-like chemotaxis protein